MGFEPNNSILDIVEFNPTRRLKKGEIAPFVEMAAIPENDRNISSIEYREVKGGSRFKNGDTLFARITPCLENGKTAKVSGLAEDEIAHGSTEFIVMAAKEPEYDEDFVYYLSRLPEFRTFAQNLMQGTSGRQRVSWQSLTTYESCFPQKQIRKHVGQVLKAFDDKIELNRQINQTLEAMAQAMFKSWFVDFEPVKAKIAVLENGGTEDDANLAAMQAISGKTTEQLLTLKTQHPDQYQQLHHTASLFPTAMQTTELGEIPVGWEVSTVGQEFDVTMGQSPPGSSYNEDKVGTPFFQGRRDFGWRYPEHRVYTTDPKRMAKAGDTLLSVRAPVGDINKATIDCCVGRGLAALRHKTGCEAYSYYSCWNLGENFKSYDSEGTVFGSINQKSLKALQIIKPADKVLDSFSKIVGSLDLQINNLSLQSKTLAELRDTLLPKLLSGELQLSTEDVA